MVDPDELRRHRRALRILVVVLIPLAIWTVVGLIALWPGNISSHVNPEMAGYNVEGVTYPSARITGLAQISCEGLSGSTPGVSDTRCANATAELLDGDDQGKSVTVPLSDAIYSSGVKVGQEIILIRVPPDADRPAEYQFSDFERRTPLIFFTALFVVVVIAVARWRGLASLVGLGFAAFILVKFMFPALVAGSNPIMVGLIGYFLSAIGPAASIIGMLLAVVPLAAVLFAVRIIDRWEPEPRGLLVLAVAWGAVAAVGLAMTFGLMLATRRLRHLLLLGGGAIFFGALLIAADNRGSMIAAALAMGGVIVWWRPRLTVVAGLVVFGTLLLRRIAVENRARDAILRRG